MYRQFNTMLTSLIKILQNAEKKKENNYIPVECLVIFIKIRICHFSCLEEKNEILPSFVYLYQCRFRSSTFPAHRSFIVTFATTHLHGYNLLSVFFISISVHVTSKFPLKSSYVILVTFQASLVMGFLRKTQNKSSLKDLC